MKADDEDLLRDAAPELLAAVIHTLRRIGEDPAGVGYYAGYGTEVFERAVRAYANATGRDEQDVAKDVLDAQKRYADPEWELRMLRLRIERIEDATDAGSERLP